MSLFRLRCAAFITVGIALITAGFAYGSADARYVVIALLMAIQGMVLVYRAAASQGIGCDGLTGLAERALAPAALSWTTLALALVTVLWGWRSGVGDLALVGCLVSGHAAFFAHYTRDREAAARGTALAALHNRLGEAHG